MKNSDKSTQAYTVPAIIRERSINRRHVYTQQAASTKTYQAPACIYTAGSIYKDLSSAGMYIQTRQHQTRTSSGRADAPVLQSKQHSSIGNQDSSMGKQHLQRSIKRRHVYTQDSVYTKDSGMLKTDHARQQARLRIELPASIVHPASILF